MYLGYIKTDDIVKYCEKMARDYELTNPSYSDACSDVGNKCLDLSNRDVVEVEHGEWQEVKRWECTTHSVTDMRCSVCHCYASQVLPHQTTCTYDFCPFCGADMREWNKTNSLRKQKEKNMRGEIQNDM